MTNKKYTLRYLPLFEQDLTSAINYISDVFSNTEAAFTLILDVETAIQTRLHNPTSFEPFPSTAKRTHPYYRIYIRNYTVYYVVIDHVMEVRRFLYNKRNIDKYL